MNEASPTGSPFPQLYATGDGLKRDLVAHVERWPHDPNDVVRPQNRPHVAPAAGDELRDRTYAWFNLVAVQVLPHTTYSREDLNFLLRRCVAAIGGKKFVREHRYGLLNAFGGGGDVSYDVEIHANVDELARDADDAMSEALRVVRTAAAGNVVIATSSAGAIRSAHISNTAFILMWMDKSHPELVDVHETVKEVFGEFGIKACRADEVQHQERITDVVLRHIQEAEFLFADLTGERPNVYYEVGYAHALGKRPILYRRSGTSLHFDLSVHNVPEYANLTELRQMLRERLAAITGRSPAASASAG